MASIFHDADAVPPRGDSRTEDETSVKELLKLLRRRRATIILTMALLTIPAALYGLWVPPLYTASASLLIEPQADRVISVEQVRPDLPRDAALVETQANLIRSRPLVTRTMDDLGLFRDPEFLPAPAPWTALLEPLGAVIGDLREALGWQRSWTAPWGDAGEFWEAPPLSPEEERQIAQEIFDESLEVDPVGNSYVLQVSFTSFDPVKAARIANHLADLYVERQLRDKADATAKANSWIEEQLRNQQGELQKAEQQIAEIRSEHQFAPGGAAPLVEAQMQGQQTELTRLGAEQARIEAKLALIDRLQARGDRLDALAEALASPVLAQLRIQEAELLRRENPAVYLENHPRMVALREEMANLAEQADAEVDRIVRSLRDELGVLREQADVVQDQFQAAKDQNALDNTAAVRLQEIEREAAAKRTLFEALLQRQQETSGLQGILDAGARIISPAEAPSLPSTPGPATFAAVGLVASALFGCLFALVREQLDGRLRTARQVEEALHVPCFGLVPNADKSERRRSLQGLLRRQPHSPYAHSIRRLYSALNTSAPGAKAILVASALPDEGRTSLASALAACASETGETRTLLVDFDLRKPEVARNFGRGGAPGIVELLDADGPKVSLEKALISDATSGVTILPAGKRATHARSSLTPQKVGALLDQLRERYDRIYIDAPPLLTASDAQVLASCADAAILAIRWETTSRAEAEAGLETLSDASANVLGAVLTRVDLKRQALYGPADGGQGHHGPRFYAG